MIKQFIFACLFFISGLIQAQCPSAVTQSTNGKCFYVSWPTGSIPSPLPTTLVFGGVTYTYTSGAGTTASPAIYADGVCPNSTPAPFTGNMSIGGMICSYAAGILPIIFDQYAIQYASDAKYVTWKSIEEINVSHFSIYSSMDNEEWNLIDLIEARGSGTFYNNPLPSKTRFVKVIEEDYDGLTTDMGVLQVRHALSEEVTFYPNPANSKINMTLSDNATITGIKDFTGKECLSSVIVQASDIDISALQSGIYYIEVTTDNVTTIHKIVIL